MKYALYNCAILDVEKDTPPATGYCLLFDSDTGLIEKIAPAASFTIPSGYEGIDLSGRMVMPGLINAHAHLISSGKPSLGMNKRTLLLLRFLKTGMGKKVALSFMKKNIANAVNAGVTTLRSMGDPCYYDRAARDLVEGGSAEGPRLLVSGKLICATGGHGDMLTPLIIDSPWEGRRAVRRNYGMQVDHIKLISTGGVTDSRMVGQAGQVEMTVEEIAAICDEAHRRSLLVGCHAESTRGVREALLGGVDTIEHGAAFDDEILGLFLKNPNSLRGYSAYIPTLSAPCAILNNPMPSYWDEVKQKNAELVFEGQKRGVRQAVEAGVTIGCGTDAGVPFVTHYDVWKELTLLMEYGGMSAREAIRAATIQNAEILGIEGSTGSLKEGKRADLMVLKGDPLDSIETLAEPLMVVAGGKLIRNPRVRPIKT